MPRVETPSQCEQGAYQLLMMNIIQNITFENVSPANPHIGLFVWLVLSNCISLAMALTILLFIIQHFVVALQINLQID